MYIVVVLCLFEFPPLSVNVTAVRTCVSLDNMIALFIFHSVVGSITPKVARLSASFRSSRLIYFAKEYSLAEHQCDCSVSLQAFAVDSFKHRAIPSWPPCDPEGEEYPNIQIVAS